MLTEGRAKEFIYSAKRYAKQYQQVASELHDGIAFQSCESDKYSFGRILLHVNNEKLKFPLLDRMANECLSSNYKMRPNKRFKVTGTRSPT